MPDRTEKEFWELLHRMDEGQKFIIKNIDELKEELKEERHAGSQHRRSLHEKIERQGRDYRELEQTVITIGQIATQQQENIRTLTAQIKPVMQRWEDLRVAGKFFSWILVILGVSGTTLFFTAREWLSQLLRRMFGL
jgi:chromosome segregation ATPase